MYRNFATRQIFLVLFFNFIGISLSLIYKKKTSDLKVRCKRDLESHARHLPTKSVRILNVI